MDTAPAPPPPYPEHLKATAPGVPLADVRASVTHEAERAVHERRRPAPNGAGR